MLPEGEGARELLLPAMEQGYRPVDDFPSDSLVEPLVLRGAETWLSMTRPLAVIMEISPALLHTQGWSEDEICERLVRYGFDQMRVIHDSDTFFGDGRLINDYFNILCWKGEQADEIYRQLPSQFFLERPPANALDFVKWSSFSTAAPLE